MSKKCPRCGSTKLLKDHHEYMYCMVCERYDLIDSFPEQSVFDRITVNEETLAEELVFPLADGWWISTIIDDGTRFATREAAVSETIDKLKEVEK